MKRIIPILILLFAASSFRVSNPSMMKFEETKYNFGFIHQGDIVSHEFAFTNTGEEPLTILDVEVTCKCTTIDFPKQPIPKGGKGTVKVTFDSKSAMDRQERTVLVKSTASNSPVKLTFKAVVLKKKE